MVDYRHARSDDADAIARLHARSWRESYRGSFEDAFLDGDLVGERRGVWRERLADAPPEQYVETAWDGPRLVGFVCAFADHDRDWGSLIDNLHVASEAKRGGLGTALMRRAGAWLAERYPDVGVYLWVLEANRSARRFYETLGATDSGTSAMETHGASIVRSCRYTWPDPALLASR